MLLPDIFQHLTSIVFFDFWYKILLFSCALLSLNCFSIFFNFCRHLRICQLLICFRYFSTFTYIFNFFYVSRYLRYPRYRSTLIHNIDSIMINFFRPIISILTDIYNLQQLLRYLSMFFVSHAYISHFINIEE